jgi:hypothetical protein
MLISIYQKQNKLEEADKILKELSEINPSKDISIASRTQEYLNKKNIQEQSDITKVNSIRKKRFLLILLVNVIGISIILYKIFNKKHRLNSK